MVNTLQELNTAHISAIVTFANEIYRSNGNQPVKILDLATGPNGFNPIIVRCLIESGIDFDLILSDISPKLFKIGYTNLEKALSPDELQKVTCVLADSRDLRSNLNSIKMWGHSSKTLEEVLKYPEYAFLQKGYQDGKRAIDFSDGSFDMLIGNIPYSSINTGPYCDAINESARVLKKGGYHIVNEMHVEKIQSYGLRLIYTLKEVVKRPTYIYSTFRNSLSAILRAKSKSIQEVKAKVDTVLTPVVMYSVTYNYPTEERIPEQTMQYGDIVKSAVLIHQK